MSASPEWVGADAQPASTHATTFCRFASSPFTSIWGSGEGVVKTFIKSIAGWDMTEEDVADIALRNYYFNHCVSLREGYHPAKDDYLPPRCFDEPVTDKYGTTWVWGRDEYEQAKKEFYVDSLKLTEEGLPPRAELERLGLDFVIPVLDPLNGIG